MKICPFVSHMIGDETVTILEAGGVEIRKDNGQDKVAVLGYEDREASKQSSKGSRNKASEESEHSHLFCIKETCRFYTEDETCKFDAIHDAVKRAEDGETVAEFAGDLKKDMDKFWQFQTKSVAELISTMGDTEKKQDEAFSTLKSDVTSAVESLASAKDDKASEAVQEKIEELRESLVQREEGLESLSSTLSEMVINIDDALNEIRGNQKTLSARIEKVEAAIPNSASIEKSVTSTIEKQMRSMEKLRDGIEKTLESQIKKLSPEKSGSMAEELSEFVKEQRRLDEKREKWQKDLDRQLGELRDQQSSWDARLEDMSKQHSDAMKHITDSSADAVASDARLRAKKLNNLGVASFHAGALKVARDQFLEAVGIDGTFAEGYNNLGLVYSELDERERATEAFSRAIEINPELHAAYNNLGYIYYKQGKYDRAIEMYNEALGRSSNNSAAYTNLGNAYFKQGSMDEARTAWEKAIELDPSNQKAVSSLKELEKSKA